MLFRSSLLVNTYNYFGQSVAINSIGDRIVVGAFNGQANVSIGGTGLVYIYISGSTGWRQEKILSGSAATQLGDYFGWSVAMNAAGDRAIIGASLDEAAGNTNTGLAYIFVSGASGWTQQAFLSGSLAVDSNDQFGWSVAMNATGDHVAVGAMQDKRPNSANGQQGLTYIFASGSTGWIQQSILSGSLAVDVNDNFGFSVGMNSTGDRVVVGAYRDERLSGSSAEGIAYLFEEK